MELIEGSQQLTRQQFDYWKYFCLFLKLVALAMCAFFIYECLWPVAPTYFTTRLTRLPDSCSDSNMTCVQYGRRSYCECRDGREFNWNGWSWDDGNHEGWYWDSHKQGKFPSRGRTLKSQTSILSEVEGIELLADRPGHLCSGTYHSELGNAQMIGLSGKISMTSNSSSWSLLQFNPPGPFIGCEDDLVCAASDNVVRCDDDRWVYYYEDGEWDIAPREIVDESLAAQHTQLGQHALDNKSKAVNFDYRYKWKTTDGADRWWFDWKHTGVTFEERPKHYTVSHVGLKTLPSLSSEYDKGRSLYSIVSESFPDAYMNMSLEVLPLLGMNELTFDLEVVNHGSSKNSLELTYDARTAWAVLKKGAKCSMDVTMDAVKSYGSRGIGALGPNMDIHEKSPCMGADWENQCYISNNQVVCSIRLSSLAAWVSRNTIGV